MEGKNIREGAIMPCNRCNVSLTYNVDKIIFVIFTDDYGKGRFAFCRNCEIYVPATVKCHICTKRIDFDNTIYGGSSSSLVGGERKIDNMYPFCGLACQRVYDKDLKKFLISTGKHFTRVCASCGRENPSMFKCSRCHVDRYCNAACQRAHWTIHKPICAKHVAVDAVNHKG